MNLVKSQGILLQDINPNDIANCYEIERHCFSILEMFQSHEIKDIIERSQIAVKAIVEDKVVGYALARYANRIGYLFSNAVLPHYRNRGIGHALMEHRCHKLWEKCDLIQAHTNVNNKISARILMKNNFKPVEYVTDFYGDDVDATRWEVRV